MVIHYIRHIVMLTADIDLSGYCTFISEIYWFIPGTVTAEDFD